MLSYLEFITFLSNIENVVNSRPLTYVHSEVSENNYITPNSFLKIHYNNTLLLPRVTDCPLEADREILSGSVSHSQLLLDNFCKE